MKFNPFRPNNMVGPGMFVGRIDELRTIEQCLYQAKNGNPQHFLVEGERGIGKSSLMFLGAHVAKGTVSGIASNAYRKFLTVSVDMGGVRNQIDIVGAIARQLRTSIDELEGMKASAMQVWEFLSKWEVAGIRYHREEGAGETEDARDRLVQTLVELLRGAAQKIEGVFIIIDEADAPPDQAGLGEFLKLFTERLTKSGCDRVLVGLAGLPSTLSKLRASHESSPRLLEVLRLEPLTHDESERVVQRGLEDAEEKNGAPTAITKEALALIANLSEGYPHFIQQFAYCAFAQDTDDVVDVADVNLGAYQENGALMQLGAKYFSEMYHAKISSEDYRRVLRAMASHGDEWVSRRQLIDESMVSKASVANALSALKDRQIILADKTRKGFYRLPTKSFAAWINAIRSVDESRNVGPTLFGNDTK